MTRADVLHELAAAAGRAATIAVDGFDAAGKTTLADELAPILDAGRVSIDDFLRPRAERYARGPESPEGYYLDSFDLAAFRRAVLASPPPAVCDGVFLQRPELDGLWEFRIFVSVTEETVLARATERDADLFGGAAATRLRYERRYLPAQRRYVTERDPLRHADAVLENDDPTSPRLVLRR